MSVPGVAFKAIKPKPFNEAAVNRELRKAALEWGKFLRKDIDRLTQNWEGERPKWKIEVYSASEGIVIAILPANPGSKGHEKFGWLDRGTRPHTIVPKKAKALHFFAGGKAGSRPGNLRTFKATKGTNEVFSAKVHHPGTKARKWMEMIAKQGKKEFGKWMQPYMQKAAKASGHAKS